MILTLSLLSLLAADPLLLSPPPTPPPEAASQTDEPRVLRHEGKVCVQTVDANKQVQETCRPETGSYVAPSATALGWASREQRATLVSNIKHDSQGFRRGMFELSLTFAANVVPIAYYGLSCGGNCDAGLTFGVLIGSWIAAGLVPALLHRAFDGQAGIGYGFLGAGAGGIVSVLLSLPFLFAFPLAGAVVAVVLAITLPTVGAVMALELRDTTLRKEALASISREPVPDGVVTAVW